MYHIKSLKAGKALLLRNIISIKYTYIDGVINALITSTVLALSFGYFLPLLNIPSSLVGNMFVGSLFFTCVQMMHTRAMSFVFDIAAQRTIDFYMIAPIGYTLFIITHVISLMLEFAAISLPALLWGKLLLGYQLPFVYMQPILALIMYLLTLLFFSSITLALGICSPFGWFTTSAHARFLVPMAHLGCANLPWASIAAYFPTLKYLFLLSPLTYVIEGLRTTIMNYQSIPLSICMTISAISCVVCLLATAYALKNRLDYV